MCFACLRDLPTPAEGRARRRGCPSGMGHQEGSIEGRRVKNGYLKEKIENLPDDPGVYLFKDEKGTILYVGKAGNIKHRVGSYFQRPDEKDAKTLVLLERVADIDTIVTDTEKEAFILENNLIKEYRPRYNIRLRDDKTYPLLKLSLREEFPTLCIVRRAKKGWLPLLWSLSFGNLDEGDLEVDSEALSHTDLS